MSCRLLDQPRERGRKTSVKLPLAGAVAMWSILLALATGGTASAQSIEIVACDWSQARGVHLSAANGDLAQSPPPEVEQGTRLTVNCRLTVRGVVPEGSQFVVATDLTEPRWELTTPQGTERPIEGIARLPLADANIILEGLAPSTVHEASDALGLDQQVVRRTAFTLLDISTQSGGSHTPFDWFEGASLHPETVRVEQLLSASGPGSSPRQERVIQRAQRLLDDGYPTQAAAVLEGLEDLVEAEARLEGARHWQWILLTVGVVAGAGGGALAGYLARGMRQKSAESGRATRRTQRTRSSAGSRRR
jgi:hypothetical protein